MKKVGATFRIASRVFVAVALMMAVAFPSEQAQSNQASDTAAPRRISFSDIDIQSLVSNEADACEVLSALPKLVVELDGKRVVFRGYMKPQIKFKGLSQFVMTDKSWMSTFGPRTPVCRIVPVTLMSGTTTDYIEQKPFDVIGRFRIEVIEEDGIVFVLYWIDDAQITLLQSQQKSREALSRTVSRFEVLP